MGLTCTKGMKVTFMNDTDEEFCITSSHSYQFETWPPSCFPQIVLPGKGHEGRVEAYWKKNDINLTTSDSSAEITYTAKNNSSLKVEIRYNYQQATVSTSGTKDGKTLKASCGHWYYTENSEVTTRLYFE
eukprot:TRINITY_DN8091_c0_g1_i1.p1 TRINITY_DN8091_c0_g1~~TRINITY_DN8091_c0_g1_i1.p1  ORF type:complete len:130 (-),score=9.46 TRINITY_DN8091_c0_g1_i1:22-411(-)